MNLSVSDLFFPERIPQKKMGGVYEQYPIASRIGCGTSSAVLGFIKPFVAPILAALGLILSPIMAGVAQYKGDREGRNASLKTLGVSVLTLSATFGFMIVTAYFMPLVWSSALVVGIVSLSIILHVRHSMKEPIIS